jgi:hypothetical protein
MMSKKYWVIFETVVNEHCEWALSTRKMTIDEAERISADSVFHFNFLQRGLELAGSISLVIGACFVDGTREEARKKEKQLNENLMVSMAREPSDLLNGLEEDE